MASFSLLSLNTFGVPLLSSRRLHRLTAELMRLAPTVICLQEIQQNIYLPLLKHGLAPYSHFAFFHNRIAPKGGLFIATASACPEIESKFFPFPNQGRLLSIGFSDWWLNKGVLRVSLEVGGCRFVIMNTHLQANYAGDWQLSNLQTQIQLDQVSYLVELIHAQPVDAWVIVCGDFNFPRQTPVYEWMAVHSGLIDPLAQDPRPTYQPFPLVPSRWKMALDYFFYRAPPEDASKVMADIIPIVNNEAHFAYQRFLTDHKALILQIG
jgi:endonuclease/exonuclease/phosphatase family metal-dependent hydrolase